MTELSFLVELLLNHKLPKVTRDAVASRIRAVEASGFALTPSQVPWPKTAPPANLTNQAASTLALMAKHNIEPPPVPVDQVAQTPAAVAAINARQEAINQALSGKPAKGQTSPRKF